MAEQYPANDPGNTNDTTRVVPVTRDATNNGVEVYEAPKKRGFPWWVLLFGLIPLLLLFNRPNDQQRTEPTTTATPVAVTSPVASPSASPGVTDSAATNGEVSRTGSAALPPTGGTSSAGSATDAGGTSATGSATATGQ